MNYDIQQVGVKVCFAALGGNEVPDGQLAVEGLGEGREAG